MSNENTQNNEVLLAYLKITDVVQPNGNMDYHGLDINSSNSVVHSSAIYNSDYTICYLIYNVTDYTVPDNEFITQVTEQEYKDFKDSLETLQPVISDSEKIAQLEEIIQTLILEKEGL
ncbi:hypothetical protein [Lysinibacillus fusiformis]|uniref:hypothetical protein n=1 Tax=Lysinibacillus fusiformis TaxID=28031 RepID=UPI0023A9465A|nr:hypothetical protein [Lysinibacillus fusiformis]WEA38054.1 hypothetical protein PWJ66_15430 [Lysinibacillus fusiformis]